MTSTTELCVGLSITRVDKAAINFLSGDLFWDVEHLVPHFLNLFLSVHELAYVT